MAHSKGKTEVNERPKAGNNSRVVFMCLGIFGFMLAMSFAAVPLYDLFCRVTGYGGTTQVSEVAPDTIKEHTVKVRFDANVNPALGWSFRPEVNEVTVRLGEVKTINYIAQNMTARTTVGTSTFNVTPGQTGQFFSKMQCFCFTEQKLEPGQRVEMPVVFYVDPAMLEDEDARDVNTIILSYTYFEVKNPQGLTLSSASGQ